MYVGSEQVIDNETLREVVYVRQHESGLRVGFCPRPGFNKRYACFSTDFGSMDAKFRTAGGETIEVPAGVAHFLEHKLFEEADGSDAFDKFSALGASSNAYTSFGNTAYLFSCNSSFYENLGILVDFVQSPHFTDENVEKEKGIIGEEISMYRDNAGWRIFTNLLELLFDEHPIRLPILGDHASIATIDKETLYRCHEMFYHPQNMILFAVGDLRADEYFGAVDRALSKRKYPKWSPVEKLHVVESTPPRTRERRDAMSVAHPRVAIGFKDTAGHVQGRDLIANEQITDILIDIVFGRSSTFFERLYQDELIDEGFGGYYSTYGDAAFSYLGGETPDPERLRAEVLAELDRVRKTGVSSDDFERQRRASMGSFFRQFNSLEYIANHFCGYHFLGANLFDVIDVLHGLRLEDLEARLREHFVEDLVACSTIVPS